ncbi:hypothetical protein BO70DRAFT_365073 [Aspergillus heteromorphus CBS 117.55]|uniref:Uncharacterized protein n=1 Tax=Aspergillus heteromorphus CBS 117.55 TaxID=1448321 RepID=A0A317VIK4_9EURO|nr:uncharacterized protein BO70DRAFT_365073 [Aspergillus heteromorphus CBS 117.55]PWY71670.1 hypothetical protein BO70DRAFT_365073 [Aspergillus heteromorphus CBS 117.55]
MMIQNRELEQLQAKIREAEERLKSRQSIAGPPRENRFYGSSGEMPSYHSRSGHACP